MGSLLIAVIYLIFISLGLPDSLLGSGWPSMQITYQVPSSYAGYISVVICLMTIISALLSPFLIKKFYTKYLVAASVALTVVGLLGFSVSKSYYLLFLCAIPYGLGAGTIDSAINHYVANHYSAAIMNYLHCFYGVGATISPVIMAAALKYARWNEGYSWTAFIQIGILLIVMLSFPLWNNNDSDEDEVGGDEGILQSIKVPGVICTLIAFFAYCSGEATCFLWVPSFFEKTRPGLSSELIASFGSLIFAGLMIGRIISGLISNRFGDRLLIRIGIVIEIIGIMLVALPIKGYIIAAAGFLITGIGMGPVYPAIQHMAPENFGKKYSSSVIGLQMASAYVGSALMPFVFGILQLRISMLIMPVYLLIFALLNIIFLEIAYVLIRRNQLSETEV